MKTTIRVPGRTELGGNHTDHQGGHVLASAVNIFIRAEVEKTDRAEIKLSSQGFGDFIINLDSLSPREEERGTAAALIRGVADYLSGRGFKIGGYNASVSSDIPVGSGLSSSAAFEVLAGRIFNRLYNNGSIPELELAQAGRYAETLHFGKPCGLMDQCACTFGGIIAIDFSKETPVIESINADFKSLGYTLFIIGTGEAHSKLTEDYAAITRDMRAAAACFNKELLSQVSFKAFLSGLPELRRTAGDRVVLRALHYFEEDIRAQGMAEALKKGNMGAYIALMDEASRSSAELLQNSYSPSKPHSQGISLALAIGRRIHGREGATRVHGGGFAGTVQALLPNALAEKYRAEMEGVFGAGSCMELEIYK
jgi:galactokinase